MQRAANSKPVEIVGESAHCGRMPGQNNIVPLPSQANTVQPTQTHPTAKTTSNPRHTFKYAGRKWRLFKRSRRPDASWYVEFQRAGVRTLRSLETTSITHAETEAKSYIDAFLQHRRDQRSGLAHRDAAAATLAQVFAIVPNLPITAGQSTRNSYVWSLRWVLRLALDVTDDQIPALRADVLSKDTARRYFTAVMAKARQIASQGERATFLRTACTFFDNARALFAPLPLDALRETFGLVVPAGIDDFRNGKKLFLREKISQGSEFERPPDAVVRRTLVEWVKLGKTRGYQIPTARRHGPELSELHRRNVFIAVGLALSCGLRAGEFEQVRWNWFRTENGRPLLSSTDAQVKNRSGAIKVKPLGPFWDILNRTIDRNGWRGQSDDYCLAEREKEHVTGKPACVTRGGASDRVEWPKTLASQWLRWLGWTTQKTNHALRDLAASWVTMKFGLERARIFCRHGQSSTTASHYNRFVDADVMDNPKRLAWLRWAK